jgi:hypothetical protein
MTGNGTVSAGNDTAPIAAGDALPIRVDEAKAFENTGTEPLELLVIGVARDMQAKADLTMSPSGARGALAGDAGRGALGRGAGRGDQARWNKAPRQHDHAGAK